MARAFRARAVRYDGERAWNMGYHVDMWRFAASAERSGRVEDFEKIYWELRNRWQVFRPSSNPPSPSAVAAVLGGLDPAIRRWELAELATCRKSRLTVLWNTLVHASRVKMNRDGPSVMAVSKFLHFWNPRLFVILDAEVMRDLVFGHAWLADGVAAARGEIATKLPGVAAHDLFPGELGTYLATLLWAGRLIGAHPGLMPAFITQLERYAKRNGTRVHSAARRAQGAAVEWLLLGLVELPPAGVTLPRS